MDSWPRDPSVPSSLSKRARQPHEAEWLALDDQCNEIYVIARETARRSTPPIARAVVFLRAVVRELLQLLLLPLPS
jgi:hypothetical protein